MKHLNSFADYTVDELKGILLLAEKIKKNQDAYAHILDGKKLYTLFEKTSNRTYLSFVIGMEELGGKAYNQLWKDSNFTIGDLMSEIKSGKFELDIVNEIRSQQEKYHGFDEYELCCSDMERFWESVVKMLKIYLKG